MDANSLPSEPAFRRIRLRYAAACLLCGQPLEKGTEALFDRAAKTVRCIQCKHQDSRVPIDNGTAGASARREYERRRLAHENRVKARFGHLIGGAALAIAGESQSTRAWSRGSVGEQKLADALAGLPQLVVLHDRRVPKTRANIDHIVIGPAGVFVVDTKRCQGLIRI